MDGLSTLFSFALLSSAAFLTLLALIFKGEANTLAKYTFAIIGSCVALVVFGISMSGIVKITVGLL